MTTAALNYLTVCSGVEAFGPAWHRLGFRCVGHSEIDAHASAVLRYHFPTVTNFGDFTTITPERVGATVDVLAGGTPCQDFSVAGFRAGLAGDKGNLTLEFVRLADRLRPRWLVWENVPGVLSNDGGRAFGALLGGLAECGYGFAYRVLNAKFFGVPQSRDRVFVVGYLGDWRPAAAVLFESESLCGDTAPRGKAGQDIAGTLESRASGGGGGPGAGTDGAAAGYLQPVIAGTLTATKSGQGPASRTELAISGYLQVCNAEGASGLPCLTASNVGKHVNNQTPLVASGSAPLAFDWAKSAAMSMSVGPIASTLRAAPSGYPATLAHDAVRRLTPLECERLMGYPDDWTRHGTTAKGTAEISDTQRYRMCGNGWATPVAVWVAARLMEVERMLTEINQ